MVAMGRKMSQVAWMEAFMNKSMPMQNSRDLHRASCQRLGSIEVFDSGLEAM